VDWLAVWKLAVFSMWAGKGHWYSRHGGDSGCGFGCLLVFIANWDL